MNGAPLRSLIFVLFIAVFSNCSGERQTVSPPGVDTLHQKIQQSNEELMRTRARQHQELSVIKEEELPSLRGQLETTQHQAYDLQGKQEDMQVRSESLEHRTRRLEQWAAQSGYPDSNEHQGPDLSTMALKLEAMDDALSMLLIRIEELHLRLEALERSAETTKKPR